MADYKCLNCDIKFDNDGAETVEEYRGECWGIPAYEQMTACPNCKSTDVEPLKECPYCDAIILESEDCCGECANALNSAIDIHRIFRTSERMDAAEIEINPYLAEIFSAAEINEILFAHLKEAAFSSAAAVQKVIKANQKFIEENAAEYIAAYKEMRNG